ncbi:hypothetical protein EDD21DRAFT_374398 [Dissophora ornata]|nr:hypothetical protein EDD21DRAFT_374398 [Dissophora ornata]
MRFAMKRFNRAFPATLARIQSGTRVNLRDGTIKTRGAYDLKTVDSGQVLPLPAGQKMWKVPNGCSLRSPYSTTFQDVAESFEAESVNIFIIEKHTPIPNGLVLICERGDHFSLQCARPMALWQLNDMITGFLETSSARMTKEEYQIKFPAGEDNDSLDIDALEEN